MSLLYKYLIIPLFLMPAASSVGVAVGASVISTIISFFSGESDTNDRIPRGAGGRSVPGQNRSPSS